MSSIDDVKLSYLAVADRIPDWRTRDKNDLFRECAKCSDERMRDSYLAAIMLRYWYNINRYYSENKIALTPEDVYDWLVDAVMYTVEYGKWRDPEDKLYDDPAGPDKVLHCCLKCGRMGFYQFINKLKRKLNYGILSLDKLQEDYQDSMLPQKMYFQDTSVYEMIKNYFDHKDYFVAFALFGIAQQDVFTKSGEFQQSRLVRYLHTLTRSDALAFAEAVGVAEDKAIISINYITILSLADIRKKLEAMFQQLRRGV